jgi:hypothetical protein
LISKCEAVMMITFSPIDAPSSYTLSGPIEGVNATAIFCFCTANPRSGLCVFKGGPAWRHRKASTAILPAWRAITAVVSSEVWAGPAAAPCDCAPTLQGVSSTTCRHHDLRSPGARSLAHVASCVVAIGQKGCAAFDYAAQKLRSQSKRHTRTLRPSFRHSFGHCSQWRRGAMA